MLENNLGITEKRKFTLNLSRIITSIIIFYLYWVSFEWTILSSLKDYGFIQMIRNFFDILPTLLFIFCIFIFRIKFKTYYVSILFGFIAIVLLSSISLFIEIQDISPIIYYIGVTFRFVPFIFLIKYSSDNSFERFIKHAKRVYWLLVVLSIVSLINKEFLLGLILPSKEIFGTSLPTTYNDSSISASFINTIEYSFFIIALTIIYLKYTTGKKERIFVSVFTLIMMVFSYSIVSILAFIILTFLMSKYKMRYAISGIMFLAIFLIFFNDLFYKLLGMDSIETWIKISSEYNRVGYFTKLLPEFLKGNPKDILLGMGYDGAIVDSKLADYNNLPKAMINNENNLKYLKDVYWLAILVAQGLIVLLITLRILYVIFNTAKKYFYISHFKMIRIFIYIILLIGFFNQILDVKGFSYCFWVIVGFTFNDSKENTYAYN